MSDDAAMAPPKTLEFHLIKAQSYKTLHVDGMVCSLTPQKNIVMTVYNERTAIPQSLLHKINAKGDVAEAMESKGKDGIVRELEATLVLSPSVILDMIEQLEFYRKLLIKMDVMKADAKGRTPKSLPKSKGNK